MEIAREINKTFLPAPRGVVDVDWYVEGDQKKFFFDVDKEKAAYHGISTQEISRAVQTVLNGTPVGLAHIDQGTRNRWRFCFGPRWPKGPAPDDSKN